MKPLPILFLMLLLLPTANLLAQNKKAVYVQINGSVDILGNIKLLSIEQNATADRDSSNQYIHTINSVIAKSNNAIEAINLLSAKGWVLIAAVSVPKDENGRPNAPFIAYYFRKE